MNDNISAFNSNEYDEAIKMTVPYYNEIQNEIIEIVDACYNKKSIGLTLAAAREA